MVKGFLGKRIRDPVHGLIIFEAGDKRDELAFHLLNTPEMQRLRRIRQLGVSEFVFPGATHSRFAHSIGVYHCAKQLVDIIRRETKGIDQGKADEAILAALLHDVGHGPFSHAFEAAQKERGSVKRHEQWTAEIIRNPDGKILSILGMKKAKAIADMLEREDPKDIYHAVVSSSFDADRLDYLQRDRLMTGTGAGAIDFDWLMDNLRVKEISLAMDDQDSASGKVATFCFDSKALPAAEQFLLARYTLHEQVYFHKTTRAIEKMFIQLLSRIAELAWSSTNAPKQTGLPKDHPLMRFFRDGGDTVENYLALDDMVVYGALNLMCEAGDKAIRTLACRLRDRDSFKTCDLAEVGSDKGAKAAWKRKIDRKFADKLKSGQVIKDDSAGISIYSEIGADDVRMHKRLHIFDGERVKEITEISDLIQALERKKEFVRYYFESEKDRNKARALRRGR